MSCDCKPGLYKIMDSFAGYYYIGRSCQYCSAPWDRITVYLSEEDCEDMLSKLRLNCIEFQGFNFVLDEE